mgnify:CR=1 FL=1
MSLFPPSGLLTASDSHAIETWIRDGDATEGLYLKPMLITIIKRREQGRGSGFVFYDLIKRGMECTLQISILAEMVDIAPHIVKDRSIVADEHLHAVTLRLIEGIILIDFLHHRGQLVHFSAIDGRKRATGHSII